MWDGILESCASWFYHCLYFGCVRKIRKSIKSLNWPVNCINFILAHHRNGFQFIYACIWYVLNGVRSTIQWIHFSGLYGSIRVKWIHSIGSITFATLASNEMDLRYGYRVQRIHMIHFIDFIGYILFGLFYWVNFFKSTV